MKKLLVITIVLAITAMLFTGCAQPAPQPEPAPPQDSAAGTVLSGSPAAKLASSGVDVQGKLIGRIDNNSVEIEITPSDTLAFRVTDVLEQLEGIKDGDMVKFSYEINAADQMTITKIEKVQ